ncbi:type II secretion system protein Z [Vibrio sp. SM6]|uniref:Type II secretion system protein Z n=1 Tax=Vibrio agarilyticus TaxID=2726741 RepID=A0A7X8TQV0_9VIBR|nr:type II secretion system protein Z [Vibrio agarilyticus]NLS13079.1 type II secretion system protein Z [Vibrio agarilyticus]
MFDLVDVLKKREESPNEVVRHVSSVAFYQSDACRLLVAEAYRFEGLEQPEFHPLTDDKVTQHARVESLEVIIIELNHSDDVAEDAARLRQLLPNGASLVVIGSEDCISTIRKLKSMGIYYLFWPINKNELIDFVLSVQENVRGNRGLSKKRRAKQISFIGCKGGVGTTWLCAEMSHHLVNKRNSSCVVVDNGFYSSNLDIMMGIEKFKKREIRAGSLVANLDFTSSQSLLTKQGNQLSVLALTSQDIAFSELQEYSRHVTAFVSEEVNFVLDDLSASAVATLSAHEIVDTSDCIILVVAPTISSLREAARLNHLLQAESEATGQKVRTLVVLNYNLPAVNATVTKTEVEQYLRRRVDVVVPFIKKVDAQILDDKRMSDARGKSGRALQSLAASIFGEETPKRPLLSLFS